MKLFYLTKSELVFVPGKKMYAKVNGSKFNGFDVVGSPVSYYQLIGEKNYVLYVLNVIKHES